MDSHINLEKTVLGELLLESNETIDNALNILREYDFIDSKNMKIFRVIKKLREDDKNVDLTLVLSITNLSKEYMLELTSTIATTANLEEHISQLRNSTLKRKFISGYVEIAEQINHSINPSHDITNFASKLIKLSEFSTDSLNTNRRTVLDDIEKIKNSGKEKRFNFGVGFLNDALGGYSSKDVIVIGCKTGRGKSEICNIMAERAAIDQNKVLFLALEAEDGEVGARLKFRSLCRNYFEKYPNYIHPLSFDKWLSKELPELEEFEQASNEQLSKYANNIFVQYRNNEFTVDDLDLQLKRCHDVDVIILDHIHYVDILENNENQGLKKIIKCIRSNNLIYQKPIIVVAHLRKTNKKDDGIVPDEEDLHGSSDLAKIATKTILFSPDYSQDHDYLYRTFFRICKNRRNPSSLRYIANLKFDSRFNLYQDEYKLGRYKPFLKEFIDCTSFPSWYPIHYSYN